MIAYVLPIVALFGGMPAGTPAAQDGSWLAWHGCWRVTGADVPASDMLCVVQGADAAQVRLVTLVDGAVVHESVVRPDGVARPVEEGGCTGTEMARWSRDGRRVFVTADLRCDGVERKSTGVLALVAENEWVDVQSYAAGGQEASRTIRYRAVSPANVPAQFAAALADGRELARETARTIASAPLDVDEVIEATSHISAPAVQALLAARRHGFALNAPKLIRLADAGVPPATIDVMVALSHPATFAVRDARPGAAGGGYAGGGYGFDPRTAREVCEDTFASRAEREAACREEARRWGFAASYGRGWDRRYDRFSYSRYGYGYNYGYNSGYFGYHPYAWNYGGTPIVIVRPDEERRQSGALVKGSGYTTSGPSTRSAQPRSGSGSGSGATTSSGTSSAGSSSTGSTTGSSSSGSTGRTAIPRGGGGGGE